MKRAYVLIMLGVAFSAGCAKKASAEIDFGTVENSVYQNKYFGMTLKLPAEWNLQDQEAQQRMIDLGSEMIAGNDKARKAAIKAAELQTVNLLVAFKHPVGSRVMFNPSIMGIAGRVRHIPGIKRGRDYHLYTKQTLESGQMEVSFPKEIYSEQIGGVEFDVMSVHASVGGQAVNQKQYVTVMKGYALAFVVTFTTDEEEAELASILRTVTFK